jgi:hypothetical protein
MKQIKSYHFAVTFIIMIVAVNIIGTMQLEHMPQAGEKESLEELNSSSFFQTIQEENVTGILVFDQGSELCRKLEYILHNIEKETSIKFHKINIDNYSGHKISGTPSLLFYKNNMEIKRTMRWSANQT